MVRPYTPTTPPDARGFMDLVVKVRPAFAVFYLSTARVRVCCLLALAVRVLVCIRCRPAHGPGGQGARHGTTFCVHVLCASPYPPYGAQCVHMLCASPHPPYGAHGTSVHKLSYARGLCMVCVPAPLGHAQAAFMGPGGEAQVQCL